MGMNQKQVEVSNSRKVNARANFKVPSSLFSYCLNVVPGFSVSLHFNH